MRDEEWVPAVAGRQGGAFTRRQATAEGLSRGAVDWRLRRGIWTPVLGAALRHRDRSPGAVLDAHAAVLTWPDATVALGAAARLHGLPVPHDGRVEVVVPTGRRARGPLVPYQYGLDERDVTRAYGVPVTTRVRTILDCLGRLPPDPAFGLLAWVTSRRLVSADAVQDWIARHPGRWGNPARARAADRIARGSINPAEDLLQDILTSAGIGGWVGGASLLGHLGIAAQADVYFPEARLVIEVGGRSAHGARQFQADRDRQNLLVGAGCTVLRYTWHDLTARPGYVAAQVRATLSRLTASGAGAAAVS